MPITDSALCQASVAESPVTLQPKQEEPMPQPQFIPSPLKIIGRRRCQNCGTTMMMTCIESMGPGTDRRTFECDQCGHEEELLVKF
jgi:hypothetical protein